MHAKGAAADWPRSNHVFFNGDGKPDLLGCVEWSVYPSLRPRGVGDGGASALCDRRGAVVLSSKRKCEEFEVGEGKLKYKMEEQYEV